MDEMSDMRHRILSEAARLFVAQGYRGLSMREIAAACGLSKAGLYYHFRDKEELLMAVLIDNLEQMDRLIAACRRAGGSTRQVITRIVRRIFQMPQEQRAMIQTATQEMPHFSLASRQTFARVYQEKFTGQLAAVLEAGTAQGELRPMDARQGAWILLGMMYPFFSPRGADEAQATQGAVDLLLELFFNGAAGQAARTPKQDGTI
ncbi:MAG: TetR/AcrR family transcriptional regulator [Chloroflexi bacterium]|jgi:AcrR family transcriptional regulator|nr:TetR/AcrR family transcriptional regulator [Chloroflexota bacterium]